MNKKVFAVIVIIIIAAVIFVIGFQEEAIDPELNGEEADIIVENLRVNGQEGPIELTTEEESIITATFRNDGEEAGEIELSVRMDGELFDHRHDWIYELEAGETKEVEEVREDHATWYPGEFTVEAGDQTIEVTVIEE